MPSLASCSQHVAGGSRGRRCRGWRVTTSAMATRARGGEWHWGHRGGENQAAGLGSGSPPSLGAVACGRAPAARRRRPACGASQSDQLCWDLYLLPVLLCLATAPTASSSRVGRECSSPGSPRACALVMQSAQAPACCILIRGTELPTASIAGMHTTPHQQGRAGQRPCTPHQGSRAGQGRAGSHNTTAGLGDGQGRPGPCSAAGAAISRGEGAPRAAPPRRG